MGERGGAARELALLALVGALLGGGAKLADESSVTWLADLGTFAGAWVFLVAAVGVGSSSAGVAARRSGVLLTSSVLAYYGVAVVVLGQPLARVAVVWLALAMTAAPLAAAIVRAARTRGDAATGVALGAAAGAVLADGAVQRLGIAVAMGTLGDVPVRPVQAVVDVVLVVVLLRWVPTARARAVAVVTAVVVLVAADRLLPRLLGVVV